MAQPSSLEATKPLKPLWPGFEYKDHQIVGIRWMLERNAGILADEMGLGKTIQMAGLLRNNITAPRQMNLLVAPVAVLEQWKTVLRRTGFSVQIPSPSNVTWMPDGQPASNALWPVVCIVGYERLTRNPILAAAYRWHTLIFDEAHRLVSSGSRCGEIAKRVEAANRWLLTATPIINEANDLRRLFKVLCIESQNILDPDFLKDNILARSMEQLRAAIPDAPPAPKHIAIDLPFDTEAEAEFYRGKMSLITRRWHTLQEQGGAGAALERLKLFMRLRQLSLHPQIYIAARQKALKGLGSLPDWEGSSTKFNALQRTVWADPGQRWIVFCHFTEEMRMLKMMFELDPSVGRVQIYNGALSHAEKAAVVERTHLPVEPALNNDSSPSPRGIHLGRGTGERFVPLAEILLVQLQSGGTGLNLQHFNRIVFTGPWWTSALMEQAVGRAVRIGQHEVVLVYHLRLKEEEQVNIDALMMEKVVAKGGLCKSVLDAATRTISTASQPLD